ncbi:DUF742 domain-containing protein [Streptomyces sp. NPDC005438]|uniref:DUF742 domain-containing protein n=1 Tax=Streptomyces sp. NPDC005438 TaxID=3156880 RepID=UPI0033BF0734
MSDPAGVGPVRPYVITGGRVEPSRNTLAVETLVLATEVSPPPGLSPECQKILHICRRLLSVAEVAARMGQPLTIVRVLLADLIDSGLLRARPPVPRHARTDPDLLKEVLDGLHRL